MALGDCTLEGRTYANKAGVTFKTGVEGVSRSKVAEFEKENMRGFYLSTTSARPVVSLTKGKDSLVFSCDHGRFCQVMSVLHGSLNDATAGLDTVRGRFKGLGFDLGASVAPAIS